MKTEYDFDVLAIRARLGREMWTPPANLAILGPHGAVFHRRTRPSSNRFDRIVLVTASHAPDDADTTGPIWLHASISVQPESDMVPSYAELSHLRYAVWGEKGWAFQVFAPSEDHINIHSSALHLWGRLDGTRTHPNFGAFGTI